MKHILKYIGYFLLAAVIVVVAIYNYHFREQDIDIGLIPHEFSYCGIQISGSHRSYMSITGWLKANQRGWVYTYTSYAPGAEYRSPEFNVSVHQGFVVVWHKTNEGYPQFVKKVTHELPLVCP